MLTDRDNRTQLHNFRRQWKAMLSGAANPFTIPIMASRNKKAGHVYVYTPIDA